MPERERKKVPQQTNDLEIKIKDLDYTNDLSKLNITSSLAAPYPIFEFVMDVDADEITLEGVFGEDPIKLFIRTTGEDGQMQEELDIRLMLLDTNHTVKAKSEFSEGSPSDRTGFSFMAVPIDSFKTITTNVNEVYMETTMKDVLEDLIKSNTRAKPEIDENGINQDPINQIVIPPTTLYRVIKENGHRSKMDGYLDSQFGIYNGIPVVYCTYDNKLKIINLSKQIKKSHSLTVYQLAEGKDEENRYKKSSSGNILYTHDQIGTNYSGNTKFSVISKNINYIIKPTDRLFEIKEKDLDDVISKYGLIDKNKKVQKNKDSSNNRRRYNISHTGNENSDTFLISDISSLISGLASIELSVYGTFFVEDLLDIGNVIKFEPSNVEQTDIQGKYILYSTYIKFSRKTTEWHKECKLRMIRSNKTN